MGPRGPVPSLLHRDLPAPPWPTRRRAGRPWTAAHAAALQQRRGRGRQRGAGAGPRRRLVFCDRALATLVVLRLQLPHQAVAVLYGIDRATVTRAVGEVRPLLAARGFAVPGRPQVRLRTLADVVADASACGVRVRLDATETCWAGIPASRSASTRATRAWPVPSPARSTPRHPSRARTPQSSRSPPGSRRGTGRRPGGAAWSMPSPSTSGGGRCCAGSAAGTTPARPIWRSPGWSPTGPPAAEHLSRTGQAGTLRPQSRTKP
jgi:Helix-turn-helix of DDE superfamily endonuclease